MAAIADADVSIDASGNIRWTGAATTNRHTILEFIQWLMDKQDDAQAAGDDLLDITVDTPFNRSTDQIVTLNSPFNIDDTFAAHLYDGSVSQTDQVYGGETLYSGLSVIGPVETGTEYMIIQNGKVLPAFWGTGINAEASPSLVFSRHLVKSKFAGSQIDGQRITVLARELGDQYRRFPVTLGTGNSVAAISNGADIFNTNTDTTIAGWTTISNIEGFQLIDVDNDGSGEEYYSQWNKGSQTVNETYERTKWISQRGHQADITDTVASGQDNIVDNGTTQGQAQSFIPLTGTEKLTEARFQVKIGAGTPTGTLYAELWDSDDGGVGSALPTGGALARSEPIIASAITSTYEEIIFRFDRWNPATGADQSTGLDLGNAEYFIAIRNAEGDGSNYFHVEGAASSTDGTMGSAVDTSGTWGGASVNDIQLEVKSSPEIHGIPGEQFQGISVEVGYDAEAGTPPAENEIVIWGTAVQFDAGSGTFIPGEQVTFRNGGTLVSGGEILADSGDGGATGTMIVALDSPAVSVIVDGDAIEGLTSGATATIDTTITDEDKSGGTGLLLAIDDNGTSGELYLQVLSGATPVDNNLIRSSEAGGAPLTDYYTATASITTRTISPEFLGTSTGSNIIGAYGIGFETTDVGAADLLRALDNNTYQPPNNVIFTVSGLVAGEDRVLVGPRTGTSLDTGQWLLNTTLSGGIATTPETVVVVKTGTDTVPWTSPDDINWPATGIGADNSRLRVQRDDGIYARLPYDSHDSSNTFTLGTPATGTANLEVSAGLAFTRASGSFLTDGFEKGCVITTTNFTNAGNNSTFVVDTVTATTLTVTSTTGMVTETGGGGDETMSSTGWEFNNGDSAVDMGNATANQEVFLAFIDVLADATSETFTGVHTAANDRDLFVRVRDGGGTPIKTFEGTSAQFLSTAQTVAAIRTPDA
jgi:hypothetical protein